MPTIFTKIINREIPSHIVYEDDLVIAFLDISQTTKGHTLVVPKKHYKDILDIDTNLLKHLIAVSQKLSKTLVDVFLAKGINILNNCGSTAGQTVFHFHIHLIPRYDENDITVILHTNDTSADELRKRAELIKAAL